MKHALLAAAALIGWAGCRPESAETQIQKAFNGCVAAVEKGDAQPPMEVLSPSFTGPGGMSRDEARLYLMGLMRQERIGITVLSNRIEVNGARAVQNVECLLTGRQGSNLLPSDTSRRPFRLDWERTSDGWRLRGLETPEAP